ncbi:unnamed protein product [Oikopleura dioica]|uniref:Uncharacterized protein n=1 Tax=Oikopleura dioica TaxID=34765 RepID=E4XUN6_OIKDI|nr:unnamed protein product [Oikopleura dioica]
MDNNDLQCPPPAMSPSVGDVFPSPRLHNQSSLRFASTTHATSTANSSPNSGLQPQQQNTLPPQQNIVQLQIRPNQQHHCERLFDNLGRQQSGSLTRENIMSKLQRKERMRLTEEASNQIWNTAAAQTGAQTMMYNQQGQPIPMGHRFPVQAGPGGSPAVQGPPGTSPFNPIIQHRQPIVTRLIPSNQSAVNQQVRFQQAQVISPHSHQQIICSDPIKINGAVQIELNNGNSSPSNGVVTVARAPLNHNYSNNIPVAAPDGSDSSSPSDKGATAFNQRVESTPPPPQIPQIDGHNDSEDEVPAVTQRPPKPPAPKTPPFVVIPLGTTTSPKGEKGPVKEISPKQKTIVATAKVHKPGSPASSPTNRQIRMSPSHSGTYRPVGLSPRAISPGRPLQQGQSGPTLIKLSQPVTLVVNTSVKVNSASSNTLQKEADITSEDAASSRTPTVELPPPPKEENQNNEIEEAKKIIYNKLKQELGRQKKNMSTGRKTVQIKKKSDTLSSSPAQQGVSSPGTTRPRSRSGAARGEDKQSELNKKKTFEVLRQIQSRKSPNGSLASFNGKTADIRVQMPHQTIQHNSSLPSTSSRPDPSLNPSSQIQGIPIVVSSANENSGTGKQAKEKTAAATTEPAKSTKSAKTAP